MTNAVVMRTSGGIVQRDPTEYRLRALLGALAKDEYFILERVGSSDSHYMQVLKKPNGVFQLEYRAGGPSEHYQTQTKSRDKIVSALSGWRNEESAWRDDFEWQSIGHWFTQQ
jgi:hypothetical protein